MFARLRIALRIYNGAFVARPLLLLIQVGSFGRVLKSRTVRLSCWLGAALIVACPVVVFAQAAPSQVTEDSLRPEAPSQAPGIGLPAPEGSPIPAGAESLKVTVAHVVVEGAFPELDAASRPLLSTIENTRVTVAQIYQFANALEQLYARADFVLVRVTVPPQTLLDQGDLHIVVTDGFIEAMQIDNVPDRVRQVVSARLGSLVGRRHIKLSEIERRLLLAGDAPGLHLKSTLARGETPGGVVVILEGTHQIVGGTVSVDNDLPSALGTWRYGLNLQLNSPFGWGEQFYVSAQTSGDPTGVIVASDPYRLLGAGAVIPLGFDGWMINPEYTNSQSEPAPEVGGIVNVGKLERFALRTWYPVIRTRTSAVTVNAAYEHVDQSIALPAFATALSHDSYGVLRLGVSTEGGLPMFDATLQSSATFSQGLGGRDAADVASSGIPLSRQGAASVFSKAIVDAHLNIPLPGSFQFDLTGRAQTSFGVPLMVSEQFALDGPIAVSGYPSGSLNVDEGASLRAELSVPIAITDISLVLAPYVFGAIGAGRLVAPGAGEVPEILAGSFGVGLRSDFQDAGGYQGASFDLELAKAYSNVPGLADVWRLGLGANVKF